MMAFYEPIDMKYVRYGRELIKNELFDEPNLNHAIPDGNNYIIKNCAVMGYSVKDVKTMVGYEDKGAVFFSIGDGFIKMGLSYYPFLRFSVPKSQLKHYQTEEIGIEQDIIITGWGFENCYLLAINKIYEDWGRMLHGLMNAYGTKMWYKAPMYKKTPYRDLIDKLQSQQIGKMMDEYKKRKKGNIKTSNNNNKSAMVFKEPDETTFRKEAEFIFYTDGSGNWADNAKYQDKGHYSVLLKNSDEKWRKDEDVITSNQAEIKGVMAAILIATIRGYKNVTILTDSQNVIKWLLGRNDSLDTNLPKDDVNKWRTKDAMIKALIDKLVESMKKVPNLKINYISRDKNYAHAI